jgi:hypothetical protein
MRVGLRLRVHAPGAAVQQPEHVHAARRRVAASLSHNVAVPAPLHLKRMRTASGIGELAPCDAAF